MISNTDSKPNASSQNGWDSTHYPHHICWLSDNIVSVLKQAEVGVPVAELIRNIGISEQTFYRGSRSTLAWKWVRCVS